MKKSLLILLCGVVFTSSFSQSNAQSTDWVKMMTTPGSNFYDIQKAFNESFKGKDITIRSTGYKVFKRWESFVEPRVYPTGNLSLISTTWENYQNYISQNANIKGKGGDMTASTTWTAMGPFGAMSGSVAGVPRKAGRYNSITFDPSNSNIFWCAAPAGGLWKTTNNGATWATGTDYLSVIGCSDLAVDPTNSNILYLATGDGDAGDTHSIGVLKSTDGGTTWAATGLVFTVNQQINMRRLIINPSNTQILIAATSNGVYRTTDGGTTWAQINALNAYDLEFQPGNPATVYSTTDLAFYLSSNSGATFTQISNGIPTTGATRLAIAVTTNDPLYVYVLRSNSSNTYGGLYRSTNAGVAFTVMSTTPDVLANSCAGTSSGSGQGWYDLAVASSPLNKNEVIVAGVNHWKSTDGGATWTNIGCWNSTTATYVHADVHEVEYNPAGTLYTVNDGGVYQYTGAAWTDITAPANIAQMYKIGLSTLSPNLWITGHQDNGTNIFSSGTYSASLAGDGMDCFIDRTNDQNMFGSQYSGQFNKSTNGGTSWATCQAGMTGGALWVAPWKQDPVTAATLYAGRVQMFKSTNLGAAWAQSGSLPGINTGAGVIEFAIAPSNNQVIYVLHGTPGIYKSTDGGATWTNITGTVPVGTAFPTNVCVSATNPNLVWVTLSGYSSGNKVFQSTNGGTTWTNYSTGLPNLPANCIVYEPTTADRVYVGMDVGVYFRDNSMGGWVAYNVGLPNVPVHDMEISPASNTKLRAATYGRGAYQVDCVLPTLPPISNFTIAAASYCTGQPVQFNDQSTFQPTGWSWSVTPTATINTSTSQNPTMIFGAAGPYTISMVASNGNGPGNTVTQTITVNQTPTVTLAASATTVCAGTPVTFTANGASTYGWACGSASVCTYSPASTTTYTISGTTAGCTSSSTITINTNPVPVINTAATNTALCSPSALSATLTANGATTYTWNPGAVNGNSIVISPTVATIYTVSGTSAGCSSTSTISIGYFTTPTVGVAVSTPTSCAGDPVTFTVSGASTYTWSNNGFTSAVVVYSPIVATTYTVWGYNGSCMSAPITASVFVYALPFMNMSASSNTICLGNSVILNIVGGATSYTWQPGGTNGTSASYTPAINTTYTVTGTTAQGCVNSAVKSITVSPCSGILQIGSESANFVVYPNPTSDKLNVTITTGKLINVTIEMMDVSGKTVMKQTAGFSKANSNYVLNMNSLAAGVYYIKLTSSEASSQLIKIIKE